MSWAVDERLVEDKLSQLSLVEKIGQLCQETAECADMDALRERIRGGKVGSLILASTPFAGSEAQVCLTVAELNELQRVAVEESRRGVPLLFGRDIIHGHRTVFPVPLGQACAWNLELIEACSAMAALEASRAGVHWTFSPMLDIARDPRWGRVVEGYGEDPFYVGECGAAVIRGYQNVATGSMKSQGKLIACAKHFIGYGAAEGGRDYNTTEITEHSLYNIYVPPFERALAEGCMTVMSAFNEINGESASGSRRLLSGILKERLRFQGFVVSDWASVWEMIEHGLAADESDAARIAMHAGVDMEMVTTTYLDCLEALHAAGQLPMERIDDAVRRVLRIKLAYGLFESPLTSVSVASDLVQTQTEARRLARQAVQESVVLLKNEKEILPLGRKEQSLLLVGPLLHERDALLGTWAMDGNPEDVCSYSDAARAEWSSDQLLMSDERASMDQMLAYAQAQDVNRLDAVIVFVGEPATRSGENHCITEIELPDGQVELVEGLAKLECPLIVVVTSGRPLVLERVIDCASALVFNFHGGVESGTGLLDVLVGRVDATGRLPVSFPKTTGQIPIYYNRKRVGRPWAGAYLNMDAEPQFTFGAGLSYTDFELEGATLDKINYQAGEDIQLNVSITNTGQRSGVAQLQIYAEDLVSSSSRPKRFLVGFLRSHLDVGQCEAVDYTIPSERLSFVNRSQDRVIEPGEFRLYLGFDASCEMMVPFNISR
ncbi:glycoside hydrolase family 3 N-terminal domain-containing protein [Coraliomargarita algicola]|uniref:beta-glucosidase n=1 Tax=Coraliomargarita algicola TaxID=3092156 RepID=A0ABZ0RNS6_9BACT|nr:glycoside hydrolase family 3 N-terminal domain-containing protein [Coraliomargarita sp. J2-16]WPJ96758.1 glycoside hydrolase family 3 N-terminal domain-containing protein [Coraliomargarita sp. J2-16]